MKKQKKQLIILVVLLAVMLILLALVRFLPSGDESGEDTVSYEVTTLDSSQIDELTFTNENGTYSFVKDGDEWQYKEDTGLSIDSDAIDSMVEKAASYSSDNIIENVTDVSVYGLDNPAITIQLSGADQNAELYIGDYNDTANVYYMCLADDLSTVYTVKSVTISSYKNTIDDFIVEEETETETVTETETEILTEQTTEAETEK